MPHSLAQMVSAEEARRAMVKILIESEIEMKRLFLRVTDMMRQHGVDVGSDLTSLISAAIKTSPHMLVGGA